MCVWRRVRLRTSLSQPGPTRRFVEFQQLTCGGQVFVLCTPLCGGLVHTRSRLSPPCFVHSVHRREPLVGQSSVFMPHATQPTISPGIANLADCGPTRRRGNRAPPDAILPGVPPRCSRASRMRTGARDATPPRAHARNSRRCAELLHAHMRARATGRRASDGEEQLSLRSATP